MATRTNRVDAIRKIKGLMAKAGDGNDNAPERAAARQKAIDLRLKYGIGDDEMAAIEGDTVEFMGMRFLFYGLRVGPLLDRIRFAVQDAVALIGEDSADAVELLEHLRKDVKFQEEQVIKARNAALKRRYWEKRSQLFDSWDDEQDGPHAHNMTITWIKGDLRKDVAERIIGVSEAAIRKKHWAWIEAQEAAKEGAEP